MLDNKYCKTKRAISLISLFLMAIFFVMFFFNGLQGQERPRQFLENSVEWLVDKMFQDPRGLILSSLPSLAWQDTPEEMENPGTALLSWVAGITHINLRPTDTLRAQIPLLAQIDPQETAVITVLPEDQATEAPVVEEKIAKDVLVGIYNTHTGETYTLTDGTDRLTGKQGGVVKVAQIVQRTLQEKHHIPVALSDKVHDHRYASSYLESEKTAKEMVKQYPKMITLLDIHRDGGRSRQDCLVEVKGKKTAPILIIIGSDARLPFPNWKQNYKFACRLAEKMDAMYPGLCQGVRVKEGRYNQFLHPGAILVEIGSDNNSLEEAETSGEMFADALAELLKEEIKAKETSKTSTDLPEEIEEAPTSTKPQEKGTESSEMPPVKSQTSLENNV